MPLRKEGLAFEGVEFFFDQAAHEVPGVRLVYTGARLTFEAVLVEEVHEELEVVLLAAVGCGREQEEVAAMITDSLSEVVALGVLCLAADIGGAHLVGLVNDDQVVFWGADQPFFEVFVAAEHVEAGDHERMIFEGVANGGLDVLAGEDGEGEAELHAQLVLPLLDEVARCDDQAAFQVAPDHEFLYEET
jgi:hypothetical protein